MPEAASPPAPPERAAVTVVVPVYRDVALTRACLESAMPAIVRLHGARLVAVNDASPDDDMQAMLELQVARWKGRMVVLRNPSNLGFVKTANRGMRFDLAADVVLLNNDVILPDRWLELLVAEVAALPDAGTVTPMANNTTISAFPNLMGENAPPFGLDLDRINEAFGKVRLDPVEAPTGIGFCMYVRRACLQQVGDLDEVAFGRGYGEENDLCQRALRAGWKSYISPNLYVYHRGGVSFGDEREPLVLQANAVLEKRYPRYHFETQAFVARDPLRPARLLRYFDLLRVAGLPVVLHVTHGLGGGLEQHVQDLARLGHTRAASLVLMPADGGKSVVLGAWDSDVSMRFSLDMQQGLELLLPLLHAIGVDLVHYHHTMGWPLQFLSLGQRLGVDQIFTCHDFYLVNANPTLTNSEGVFDPQAIDDAVNPLYPLPKGVNVEEWRSRYRAFLDACSCVIFPSQSTRDLFGRVFEVANPVVAYHPEPRAMPAASRVAFARKPAYTVAVLGALSREKGADLLEMVAALAARRRVPMRFVLVGYAYRVLRGVRATGPYDNSRIAEHIAQSGADLVLFPALWPETYSYTLSAAIASGLPIVAPGIGAFPERLAGYGQAKLFAHPSTAEEVLTVLQDMFAALEAGLLPSESVGAWAEVRSNYYDSAYFETVGPARGAGDRETIVAAIQRLHACQRTVVRGRRERMLRALWPLYTDPRLQAVLRLVPHRLKRAFKRLLSTKPLHELISK
jgi:GT2 family glycosyltransferase